MNNLSPLEVEIIIDEEGRLSIRECCQEMIELLYRLNPNDPSIRKRWTIYQKTIRKEK